MKIKLIFISVITTLLMTIVTSVSAEDEVPKPAGAPKEITVQIEKP